MCHSLSVSPLGNFNFANINMTFLRHDPLPQLLVVRLEAEEMFPGHLLPDHLAQPQPGLGRLSPSIERVGTGGVLTVGLALQGTAHSDVFDPTSTIVHCHQGGALTVLVLLQLQVGVEDLLGGGGLILGSDAGVCDLPPPSGHFLYFAIKYHFSQEILTD